MSLMIPEADVQMDFVEAHRNQDAWTACDRASDVLEVARMSGDRVRIQAARLHYREAVQLATDLTDDTFGEF